MDHLVTQWMSLVTVSAGSCINSGQDHDTADSTAPSIVNDQSFRCARGVGPADSTGKSTRDVLTGRHPRRVDRPSAATGESA